MGIGVSLFLIALGAILYFAVSASIAGLSISTVGVILMVVGGLGLLLTLMFFGSARRTTYSDGSVRDFDRVPPVRHEERVIREER
jgi:hypothetical protein